MYIFILNFSHYPTIFLSTVLWWQSDCSPKWRRSNRCYDHDHSCKPCEQDWGACYPSLPYGSDRTPTPARGWRRKTRAWPAASPGMSSSNHPLLYKKNQLDINSQIFVPGPPEGWDSALRADPGTRERHYVSRFCKDLSEGLHVRGRSKRSASSEIRLCLLHASLVPRPRPPGEGKGLVTIARFLVCADGNSHTHETSTIILLGKHEQET